MERPSGRTPGARMVLQGLPVVSSSSCEDLSRAIYGRPFKGCVYSNSSSSTMGHHWGLIVNQIAQSSSHQWFWGVSLSCKPTRIVMVYDIRMWPQNIKLAVTFEDYHLSGNIRNVDVRVVWQVRSFAMARLRRLWLRQLRLRQLLASPTWASPT